MKPTLLLACLSLLTAGNALAQDLQGPLAGHVFAGVMTMANDSSDVGGGDYEITIFGVDAQKPANQGDVRYGLEAGGLFSLDSDVRRFRASAGSGGGSASVSVGIDSAMIDVFFGGYLAYQPAKWLRFFAGAGPLIIYAWWDTTPEEASPEPYPSVTESGLGAGVYARAGVDVYITHKVGLHAGARFTETTLSFKDTAGDVDIQGWQYYAGMAFHF